MKQSAWGCSNSVGAMIAAVGFALTPGLLSAAPPREYVVVHTPALTAVAGEWAEYRASQGWIASTLDIGELAAGADAEALRDRLRLTLRAQFEDAAARGVNQRDFAVLLLGPVANDDGSPGIPTFYHEQGDPDLIGRDGLANIATDYDYHSGFALQPEPRTPNPEPRFPLGRIPARNTDEARIALKKVQRYENDAPAGKWRRRITYLAGPGNFGPIDALLERMFITLVDQVVPYSFDVSMTYANAASPYFAPPSRFNEIVLDRLNEGALLVNYLGHGHMQFLDRVHHNGRSYPVLDLDSVARLEISDNRLPIMLIVACWAGRYDMPDGERSLSEAMLFHQDGPIAVVAGGRITHPYPNAIFQRHFSQAMTAQRLPTLGEVHLAAMRGLLGLPQRDEMDAQMEVLATVLARTMGWATAPADLRRMHAGMYHLLGDPALRIAYPGFEIADLRFEISELKSRMGEEVSDAVRPEPATAVLEGLFPEPLNGRLILTLETLRETIHRGAELLPLSRGGRSAEAALDPDAVIAHNYVIANDKIVHRVEAEVRDGRFEIVLPVADGVLRAARWLKAYFIADDGRLDAFGAISIPVQ